MSHLTVCLHGIRIHVGFYRDGRRWRIDEADVYVTDEDGELACIVDDIDRLGGVGPAGGFQSLRCLAEDTANENVVADWDRDQRIYERELDRTD